MRVLLLLTLALVATTQLPVTTGHVAVTHGDRDHEHDHHDHHHQHEHPHHDHHDHDHHEHHHHEHKHEHDHDHHQHDHEHHDHHHHEHKHQEHGHGHHHHDHNAAASTHTIDRFSPRVWTEALFATALVGAAPVVVLFFVPLGLGNADAQKPLLRVFLSFAAGGLLGDALLHLLPHSLPTGHGHDHSHHDHAHGHDHHEGHTHSIQDLAVWLYCIAGMMTFLMLEKFVRAHTGEDGHSHSHGHSHAPSIGHKDTENDATTSNSDGLRRRAVAGKKTTDKGDDKTTTKDTEDTKTKEPKHIAAAGYLNLAADFSHNFTDGLAIGATFLRGSGWQTTVAMLLHEVPHEIGDFAILIQSGFTRREAMFTQLVTALGAMAGTVLGLLIEGAGDSGSAWISPFTAGGFIYIACASVMPELLEDCSLVQSLKEGVAMCLGIGLMIVIALNE